MMQQRSGKIGPPPPAVIETEVGGDVSVYHALDERVLILNGTASDVWRLCDGQQTLEEIVTLLASAYRIEPEQIRPEVETTIDRFYEEGFLE